jgi:hypothetical protein
MLVESHSQSEIFQDVEQNSGRTYHHNRQQKRISWMEPNNARPPSKVQQHGVDRQRHLADEDDQDSFASCADGKEDHICIQGGECVPLEDSDQYFCDCSNAIDKDGTPYVGKWCHLPPEVFCDEGKQSFCVNHGSCLVGDSGNISSCDCLDDFFGKHCEYHRDDIIAAFLVDKDDEGTSDGVSSLGDEENNNAQNGDDCPLECRNGATCQKNSQDTYLCKCPEGFEGLLCEKVTTVGYPCGPYGDVCYHGSTCVRTIQGEYACDCTASTRDFAGRWCEYEATAYCDADRTFFCVNGGSCISGGANGDGIYSCSCDEKQWSGDQCEISVADTTEDSFSENCTLVCMNGGKCRNSAKKGVTHNDDAEGDAAPAQPLFNEAFEHCVCPKGFTGVACEQTYVECGHGEHYCLHGSSCIYDETMGDWSCDCQGASTSEGDVLAGKYCQHHSTSICTGGDSGVASPIYDPSNSFTFCVNDGICAMIVENGEPHPGCTCPPGYTGLHCELLEAFQNDMDSHPNGTDAENSAAILFTCFVLGTVLFFIVAVILLRWRGLKMQERQFDDDRIAKLHRLEHGKSQSEHIEEVNFSEDFDDEDLEDVELL